MPLPIRTERLLIVRFDEGHLNHPSYLEWLSDKDNLNSLNLVDYLLNPVTAERLAAYFETFGDDSGKHLLALCLADSGTFVGTATLREIGYGGLFDLGILIGDKSVRGKGLAREAIGALVSYAFDTLAARKVCSSFSERNVAVMLAFLKNGFKIEGLQREQQLSLDGSVESRYIVGLLPGDLPASGL